MGDAVVKKHGESLALKHTKLGSPSLWRNMQATAMAPCEGVVVQEGVVLQEEDGSPAVESPAFTSQTASKTNTPILFIALLVGVAVVGFGFLTVKKMQSKNQGEISKAVVVQAGTLHSSSGGSPSGSSAGSDSSV